MQKYLYHAHIGGYYVADRPLTEAELYCSRCRDEDELIIGYDTADPIQEVLEPLILWEVVVPDDLASIVCMGITDAANLLWEDEAVRAQARRYFEEVIKKLSTSIS